ncbi:MAG: beta-lactamase family protein [Clostridia bacterium]|nr:beta-lactamase family protein [Clostridia bacterium]
MYDFSKVKEYLDSLESLGIPLAGIEVRQDHEIICKHFSGYADAEKTRKLSDDDIFWIFSATKVITCIAAMRLVEEGRLSLEDNLDKYLPEFASMKIKNPDGTITDAKNKIRIIDLFTMTAGFTYTLDSPSLLEARKNKNATTREIIAALANEPLVFEPSTNFRYSLCHDVLGAVVEVVTGMSYGEYLNEAIFTPLGIKNMGFKLSEKDKLRMTQQYKYDNAFYTSVPMETGNPFILTNNFEGGGAGLYSNVGDYAKIIDAVACRGTAENGYKLLRPETVAELGVNRLCENALRTYRLEDLKRAGYGWGLCIRAMMNPLAANSPSPVGEFGGTGAASAYNLIDTTNRLSITFFTHVRSCDYAFKFVHDRLRNLTYEAISK